MLAARCGASRSFCSSKKAASYCAACRPKGSSHISRCISNREHCDLSNKDWFPVHLEQHFGNRAQRDALPDCCAFRLLCVRSFLSMGTGLPVASWRTVAVSTHRVYVGVPSPPTVNLDGTQPPVHLRRFWPRNAFMLGRMIFYCVFTFCF